MEGALQELHQGNVGIGFLQEKKLTEGIHTQYISGYKVWVMDAESRHRVRITIV